MNLVKTLLVLALIYILIRLVRRIFVFKKDMTYNKEMRASDSDKKIEIDAEDVTFEEIKNKK